MQRQKRVLIATAFAVLAGGGWWLLGRGRAQADSPAASKPTFTYMVDLKD